MLPHHKHVGLAVNKSPLPVCPPKTEGDPESSMSALTCSRQLEFETSSQLSRTSPDDVRSGTRLSLQGSGAKKGTRGGLKCAVPRRNRMAGLFYPAIHKRCSSATCTVQVSNGHHTDWLITDHRPKPCPHPARQGHRISGDRLARGGSRRWRGQIAMCFTSIRVECDPDDFTFGIDRAC